MKKYIKYKNNCIAFIIINIFINFNVCIYKKNGIYFKIINHNRQYSFISKNKHTQ